LKNDLENASIKKATFGNKMWLCWL